MRPTSSLLPRIAFWFLATGAHLALVHASLSNALTVAELERRRFWAVEVSTRGGAVLLVMVLASLGLLIWIAARASASLQVLAAKLLAAALVMGTTVLAVTAIGTALLLVPMKALSGGGDPEGYGMFAFFYALCVAWVVGLAATPVGASMDLRLPALPKDWSSVWRGQKWVLAGSLASLSVAAWIPPVPPGATAAVVAPVAVVVFLSVAGTLERRSATRLCAGKGAP